MTFRAARERARTRRIRAPLARYERHRVGQPVGVARLEELAGLPRHDRFLQASYGGRDDGPVRSDSTRRDRRRRDPPVRQRQQIARREPQRHLLFGDVLVLPDHSIPDRTRLPHPLQRARVLEDFADDCDLRSRFADDPRRRGEQHVHAFVRPNESEEKNQPAFDAQSAPGLTSVGGGLGSRQRERLHGSRREAAQQLASVRVAVNQVSVGFGEDPDREPARPESRLMIFEVVAEQHAPRLGAQPCSLRKTVRTGMAQKEVHQGTNNASVADEAARSAVSRQDRTER